MRAAAVHPFRALAGVVIGQGEMRRPVAERLADANALRIERIGHPADRWLRALLMDIPALEVLDRPGIHGDQRWVDDRPSIHERARQRIAARLDGSGKGV